MHIFTSWKMRLTTYRLIRFAVLVFSTTAPVIYIAFRTLEKREIPIVLKELKPAVHHIAFLKVHKAASTTLQNMLFRFGTERNLTFVIPSVDSIFPNVISLLETVTSSNIRPIPLSSTHFDILCLHVLYNRTAFGQILPNDTVYIGTLRDPFEYFISMMLYFPIMFERFNISGPRAITDFLEDPEKHDVTIAIEEYALYGFTKNRMAIDYGFPLELLLNSRSRRNDIQRYIEQLDKEFALVIIVEHFDESMILLKRILRWSTKDIIYIRKNANANKEINIGEKDRTRYKQLSDIDYMLYRHFYLKLWRQIKMELLFHEEVLYFKTVRKEVEDFCQNLDKKSAVLKLPSSEWSEQFEVSRNTCDSLMISEFDFVTKIREKQYPRSKEMFAPVN
ncbi:galactose-3-O-sulfotransferase 2-like [Mytilus californianus]|uniref:galactose-3-O-sulfotransferase 2-like n=1 Tax=Mytilus californianus TaxID=6549 RepID=UPI002247FABB|nr:galactose-3-O-sulfotransferase 2-like [Mytilus californianus]